MMKRYTFLLLFLALALSCRHPEVELVDFSSSSTFEVVSVRSSAYFQDDGTLNPEVAVMGDTEWSPEEQAETRVASTQAATFVRDMLGSMNTNNLIHIVYSIIAIINFTILSLARYRKKQQEE